MRVLLAHILPAPEEGGFRKGTVDDAGFGLHIAYAIEARDALPHFDYPGVVELDQSNALSVEFGPGTHWLNYPGEVRLVGGKGLWQVDLQILEVERPNPHWHWLIQRAVPGGAVTVPSHHSVVGCSNGAVTMTAWDLSGVQVSTPPVPITGPLTVTSVGNNRSAWIFTGWFG